ncbi:uncharacterized protein [Temnothorax nylanderi]|uniref:uncharacterized protein n=1 Tax=Temnothorax nylanderi TaxID=102681 RepID=UPI003A8B7508
MKQPVAARVIEFPSKRIMANTSNVLAAFAIVFLASLSLSSAFAKHNLDTFNAFEKRLDHKLQPLVREKRQENPEAEGFHLRNNSPLELEEELSEPKPVYERRAVYAEEAKEIGQTGQNDERENEEEREQEKPNAAPETGNDIEEEEQDAQDDVFSYRSMHDLIQALILADEEDIAERLQQLREAKNATRSKTSSNLLKRQAVASASASASAAAAAPSGLLGANLWDVVPLVDLDAHSCEVEAFSHGHLHVSGTIVHEFFCELRKFWHYVLIVLRNLRSELTLGPLIAGGDVVSDGISDHWFHHTSHLLHHVIREPHHLLILPDIIRDAVPFPSIVGAIHRVRQVFFKVLHFGLDLIRGHVRHVFSHFFSHGTLHLRERLHHLRGFGSTLPLVEEIVANPIVSTAATATATATATASSDGSIIVPDYHRSLAEVLSSIRGFYDGYHASGLRHLIRTGVKSFSVSSTFSRIRSYLSRIPFLSRFGCGVVEQSTTVTTSSASSASSVSSSVSTGGPVVSPVISPVIEPTIVPVAPVVPVETETASATATATATVAETQTPVLSAGPTIVPTVIPYESFSSNTAAAATATAAAAASPVVSGLQATAPLIQPVPTLSPTILSNTVSESSSVAAAASASASAAAPSTANVVGRVGQPFTLLSRRHRPRPILSTVAPAPVAAAAAAAASASASTGTGRRTLLEPARYRGLDLDIDRRIKYPLTHSRVLPATSSAAASAATSVSDGSLSSAAASSSTSSVSPGGFNFVLPREQIVGALGYDYLLPGDVIAVTLRNKSILFGRVLDTTSPITFSFLRPKLRASLLRHGGRVWNLLPRDFRDPECARKFNNPLLLRHGL